ncbi:helix-turn-helix transcriptional regulator [Novosphingobium sp. BL-8A]|uniref:helix-turn-helix domain-containing protein n=1 Tax=Novosphingobium sp. BL-8A TaxID=3127639 RepID=UPI003756F2B6
MEIDCWTREPESAQFRRILEVLPSLTEKQHQVLGLIAENRTSKEIAWELGISESAVNQRIEGVRNRTGAPPRAELARAYRYYQRPVDAACNPLPDKNPQVSPDPVTAEEWGQDERGDRLMLSDGVAFRIEAPWQSEEIDRLVPEVLDGHDAGINRMAAMVLIAGGLLLVAVFGLDLATALSRFS